MTKTEPPREYMIDKIKAVVWTTKTDLGIRHNVYFQRIDTSGTTWKWSKSFSREDLLALAKLANHIHSVLHRA